MEANKFTIIGELIPNEYKTVGEFNKMNNMNLSYVESSNLGRLCSETCRERRITIHKIRDDRHAPGHYPIEVLQECFETLIRE